MKASPFTLVSRAETPMRSDDALMALAQSGDERAFAELISRYQATVRRLCELILLDREASRDAAQDVFLRLWKARARYQPQDKLKPFVLTIARNHCRRLRYQHKLRTLLLVSFRPDVPEAPIASDTQRLVQTALHRLPEKFRIPLVLRFVDELDYEDIATIIGRTPSAARSRIHYGLKELGGLLPKEIWP